MQALMSKVKSVGSKIGNKIDESVMSEHELRVKHGTEKPESNEDKMEAAKEATTIKAMPRPAVMNVGRRIIK